MDLSVYTTDCAVRQDVFTDDFHTSLLITRTPLLWAAVGRITNVIRDLTSHRFCHLWVFGAINDLVSRHEEEFEIPVSEEVVDRYTRWRGWSFDDIWEDEPA